MFIAMVALKFSRQSYNFKEDNLLDAVAYIGAWQNYINETKPDHAGPDTYEEISSTQKIDPFEHREENNKKNVTIESPYESMSSDPRLLLDAIINLGEKNENK